MLHLHRNNRMEVLLEELCDVLAEPRNDPLEPEVIVVQSQGMERWLSMGLANRFGVWANASHPFPRAFIETMGERLIGPVDVAARFTREVMTLHLASILGNLPNGEALMPLRRYLAERPGSESRLRLAEQIADAFDQAQIYRPEWCVSWAESHEDHADFRPQLFRALTQRIGGDHFPARIARLVERLSDDDLDVALLPERVCLFGVATLPPAFIHVFDALARRIKVHWFLLAASREYVGAEPMHREFLRTRVSAGIPSPGRFGGLDGWSSPQPLLASFGRIMRDVGYLLERDCQYAEGTERPFVEPAPLNVLATLQADLCALRRRGSGLDAPTLPLDPEDRSLEFHSCHGPRRELEVVRELLRDAFERDPSLRSEDVIVLLRDVDVYAPLIDAVFAKEPGQPGYIPYRLSDRHLGATNPIAEAAAILLEVPTHRLTAAELLRIIELGPVSARFGFSPDELAKIRAWMDDLNVTWGADLADRGREGATGQPEHTIRWGLSRLLVGAAMTSHDPPFDGLLAMDVEGDDADLVGSFVECAETVITWRERFAEERSFAEWHTCMVEAAQQLFRVGASDAWCLADLLQMLAKLRADAERADFLDAVPASVIATRIRSHYETTRSTQALLTGGVTFCAMLPMRGIPARIVVMLGLDDGAFPRSPTMSSFDDVARSPTQPGDRVARDEDRHLFLETLLAARERLVITYRGRNPRDDTVLPRSVVVDELLAVIDESFELRPPRQGRPSQYLTIEHPLHAHSARYFDESEGRRVVSDLRQYRAAVALEQSRYVSERGMTEALGPVHATDLNLRSLERFWINPASYFYEVRLGAMLPPKCIEPAVLDPTDLDALGRYQLIIEQWRALRSGMSAEEALAIWTAKGRRPHANLGKIVHDEQFELAMQLQAVLTQLGALDFFQPVEHSLCVDGTLLRGVILDLASVGRIDWSPARMSAKHRLTTWLRHLFLCASGNAANSWLIRGAKGSSDELCIEKLNALEGSRAEALLRTLLELFQLGQRAPLAFFPEMSWAYAGRLHKGAAAAHCLERALREYGDPLNEDEDEFSRPPAPRQVLRLFGAEAPLTDAWPSRFGIPGFPSFARLAETVFLPYIECTRPVELADLVHTGEGSSGSEGSR